MLSSACSRRTATTPRCPPGRCLLEAAALLLGFALPAAQAAPVRNPDNGHYYDAIIAQSGISWERAHAAAEARTYRNLKGHLATVTSYAENRFITFAFPVATINGFWL